VSYFFGTDEAKANLKAEMDSWLGTPYRHRASVKGRGADCIGFVVGVLRNVGYRERFKVPDYPKDWHLHNMESILLREIRRQMRVEERHVDDLENGDLLLFYFGRTVSHAGFVWGRWVYHSVIGIGVERFELTDETWFHRRKYNMRLLTWA